MIYGSVCSGIEAATVAWAPLGWSAAFFSEIEPFPRAVLAHHYPHVRCHGDFTTIQTGQYEPIDLLVGGTPCQSFSVAGLRGGVHDERGNLALEYLRLADRLRPRWLVWENVPGVLSSAGGRDFGSILGGMGELGYGVAYRVLDAQFFGVAQRRRRVFVVGHLGDWRRAAAVLFERHSLSGHPAPRREAGKTAPTIPSRSSAGRGTPIVPVIAPTMRADGDAHSGFKDHEGIIAFALRGREGGAMPEVGGDQVGALRSASGGSSRDYVAFQTRGSNLTHGDISGTLGQNGGSASGCAPMVATSAVRRLTPVECERLQGFPDGYTDIPWRGKDRAPDGPRYKALGNSMAVPVMAWIGQRIEAVEAIQIERAAA